MKPICCWCGHRVLSHGVVKEGETFHPRCDRVAVLHRAHLRERAGYSAKVHDSFEPVPRRMA